MGHTVTLRFGPCQAICWGSGKLFSGVRDRTHVTLHRNDMLPDDDDAALKRAAAAYLGKKGGTARARNMSPEQRSEACRKASRIRWRKYRAQKKAAKG